MNKKIIALIGTIAFFAIITVLFLRGYNHAPGYWLNKREAKSCSSRGGTWRPLPFCEGNYCGDCIFITKDAGKPCQKKSDCEGLCEIPEDDDVKEAHCSSEKGARGIINCLTHFLDDEGRPQKYICHW